MHPSTLKRISGLAAVSVAGVFLFSGICSAANFTADMVSKFGKTTISGKLYVSGNNYRQETATPGGKQIVIGRSDKKVTWFISPATKEYIERPLAPKGWTASSMQNQLGKGVSKKSVGKQKMNGVNCDKYIFTSKTDPGSITQYVYKELDLPIKTEIKMPRGTVVIEFKNIKKTNPPASMFNLPKGYKKAQMPAMNMPQGKPMPKKK